MDANAISDWIITTRVSLQLQDWAIWLSPLAEILHFIGLTLLIGTAGFLDLRLLGFLRAAPVAAALEFAPWAMAGLAVNAITGVIFILIDPSLYLGSATFWAKVSFVVIAALNVAVFERSSLGARAREIGRGGDTTTGMKIVGATSLASWFLVIYFGRMLPYLGTAY